MKNNGIKIAVGIDKWLDQNGWAGWDPYSIRELPFMIRVSSLSKIYRNKFWFRVLNKVTATVTNRFPYLFLKMFNCPKKINAKGMGLFALSYFNLFEKTKEKNI